MKFQTKQEFFWKGKFGDQYIKRNKAKSLLVAHKKFFKKILNKKQKCLVLAPRIISLDSYANQNPFRESKINKGENIFWKLYFLNYYI